MPRRRIRRYPPQCSGLGGFRPYVAAARAAAATSTAREAITCDCGDAHAPSLESKGRSAKYASDSSELTLPTVPSMRTTRSSSTQWNWRAAYGLF